jgi:hypothetical protein
MRTGGCILFCVCALSGQELRISSVTACRGKPTSVSIALVSPKNRQPTALQWDLVFPSAQIHIQDGDWAANEGAIAAGKRLSCVRQLRRQPKGFAYKCILAGGGKPIPNGSVAIVKLVAVDAAGPAKPVLRLENIVGVVAGPKQLAIRPTVATITVR